MKIGFFLELFPVLSETFVSNELFQLQQHVDGAIWYEKTGGKIHQPLVTKITFPVSKIADTILAKKNISEIISAHLYWLAKKPITYFKAFAYFLMFANVDNLRIFIKSPLVAKQVEKARCTILYVHESDRAFLYALFSKTLCDLPLGIIFHTYYLFYKNKYLAQKIRFSDFCLFQSRYSLQYAKNIFGALDYTHCSVVSSPGINTGFFAPKPRDKQKVLQLVAVGRLEEAKGFLLLVQAILLLKEKIPRVHLVIVGDGSLRKRLQKIIRKNGLQKNIRLAGTIPHSKKLLALLHKADVFVLPSIVDKTNVRDVHPNAVKEAMSMGLLTIASNLGGIHEVITDGKNGFLLEAVTPEKIAEKIMQVHHLHERIKKNIRAAARKTIASQYSHGKITQQLLAVFKKHEKKY